MRIAMKRRMVVLSFGSMLGLLAGGCPLRGLEDPAGLTGLKASDASQTASEADAAGADDPGAAEAVLEAIVANSGAADAGVDQIAELLDLFGDDAAGAGEADEIRALLSGDIGAIRRAAVQDVRDTLNAAQGALLDQVAADLLEQAGVPEEQRLLAEPLLELLAVRLGLSSGQSTQIDLIRLVAQQAIDDLRAEARAKLLDVVLDSLGSVFEDSGGLLDSASL